MATVLVVDDEPGQREMLRLLLEDAGYDVREASSGEAALQALSQPATSAERVVVLLDQRMPGMDGDAVLAAVASDPALVARHRYILLTASPQQVRQHSVLTVGGLSVPIVEKPFDVDQLLAEVAAAQAQIAAAP
jgi:CheY-like chemotaxis protein